MQVLKKYLNLIILFLILAVDFVCAGFLLGNATSFNKSWKSAKIYSGEELVASYALFELKSFPSYAYINVDGVYYDNECEISLSFNVDPDKLAGGTVMPNGSFSYFIENNNGSYNGWTEILSTPVSAKYAKLSVKGELSVNEIVFLNGDKNLIGAEVVVEYLDPQKGYEFVNDGIHPLLDAQNTFTQNQNRINTLSTAEKDFAFSVETFLSRGGYVSENVSPLGVIINSLGRLIFGNSVLSVRFIPFIFSVICVILIWTLIFKELNFKNTALGITDLTLITVAICGLGYFANAYIISLPFAILSVYFIIRNFKNEFDYRKSLAFILISGALSGICVAITSKLILLVIAEIILLVAFARQKVEKNNFSRVLAIGIIGYVVIPAVLYMFATFFAFTVYSKAYSSANIISLTFKNFINTIF